MSQEVQAYPAKTQSKFSDWYEKTNYAGIEWDGWNLPMSGSSKEDCNQWAFRGCLNYKKHFDGKMRGQTYQLCCFRASCPICASRWAKRSTARILERLKASEKNQKYLKHVVVSPPTWLQHKPIEFLRKEARKMAKRAGIQGGLDIVHPFRKKGTQWYLSPHFHYLAFGWVSQTDEIFQKNGWLVKNIGIRENPIGTIMYLLSHAGVKKRRHSITWFGDLSYCKLKIEKEDFAIKCPDCDGKFQRVICFREGWALKPPPTSMEFSDEPEGWKYWLDHLRGF
jgi:hypothetical protein